MEPPKYLFFNVISFVNLVVNINYIDGALWSLRLSQIRLDTSLYIYY